MSVKAGVESSGGVERRGSEDGSGFRGSTETLLHSTSLISLNPNWKWITRRNTEYHDRAIIPEGESGALQGMPL